MAEVNIYYHELTDSWWTNSNLEGIEFTNYINSHPLGLGVIETKSADKSFVGKGLNEVLPFFISPDTRDTYFKLCGITKELEENGLKNATKVTPRQLKKIHKK
jgi:hypothetical protein